MASEVKAPAEFGERLLEAMSKVDRPGSICTSRDLPVTMPGLEVKGVCAIRLPLGETQARAVDQKVLAGSLWQGDRDAR